MRVACEDGKGCAACGATGAPGPAGESSLARRCQEAVEASREEDAGREKDGICAEHGAEGRAVGRGAAGRAGGGTAQRHCRLPSRRPGLL